MKLGKWFRALEWTRVVFGQGHLDRFVVVEIKFLFAIYWNRWNTIAHDRFHAHAFPAISIGLRGGYEEAVLIGPGVASVDTYRAPWVRFISRTHNHRMLESTPNAISVTIAGPWDRIWTETLLDGTKRFLTWGRQEIGRLKQ